MMQEEFIHFRKEVAKYHETIKRRHERGEIEWDDYLRYIEQLTTWEYVADCKTEGVPL